MSKPTLDPSDFADQMKALAEEAQKQLPDANPPKIPPTLLQMLRPMVLGLEALSRATVENSIVLARMEAASNSHDVLPRIVSEIQERFENKNEINQQLFDALHEELKGYKDGFILEVLQKPLVRDLITLYDDLAEVHRQIKCFADAAAELEPGAAGGQRLQTVSTNVNHVLQFLLEIMARMEVGILEPSTGKLNKQTQRAISVELADLESEDGEIVRSLKHGFVWRERIVRAEEVVIKKWKEGFLVAMDGQDDERIDVQTDTTDAK